MLRDDIARYTELSGEDGEHTSIQKIGAYLDGYDEGYEQGKKDYGRPKGEWKHTMTRYPYCSECEWMPEEDEMTHGRYNYCPDCGAKMEVTRNE